MSPTRASSESSTPIWPKKPSSHTRAYCESDADKVIGLDRGSLSPAPHSFDDIALAACLGEARRVAPCAIVPSGRQYARRLDLTILSEASQARSNERGCLASVLQEAHRKTRVFTPVRESSGGIPVLSSR